MRLALALALALSAPLTHAAAQEAAPESVTLRDLDALIDASPRLVAAEERADADLGDVTAAGTPENPTFAYDLWGLLGGEQTNGGSQHQMAVTQSFPWPGQLAARVAAARARHAADISLVDLIRALTRLEVRRAFVGLLAAQERERLLAEQERAIESVAEIIRGRSESGAGRRWDVMRTEAELASIRAARDAAAADRAELAGSLAVLVARPGWTPTAAGAMSDLPALELEEDAPAPAVDAARRAREAAEAALERERTDAFPSFDLRLGTLFSTWPEGAYLYGGLAIPLPFFDQNQGAIERAEHEVAAARADERAIEAEREAAVRASRDALTHRREALGDFDIGVMQRLPEITELAEVAYRGGEIEVFELLDTVRSARTLALDRLARDQAVEEAEIDLAEAQLGAPSRP